MIKVKKQFKKNGFKIKFEVRGKEIYLVIRFWVFKVEFNLTDALSELDHEVLEASSNVTDNRIKSDNIK